MNGLGGFRRFQRNATYAARILSALSTGDAARRKSSGTAAAAARSTSRVSTRVLSSSTSESRSALESSRCRS